MFGYNYALSSTGVFMGRDLLGRFFLQNEHASKKDTVRNAKLYFHEFRHMVRPFSAASSELLGTLSDGEIVFCVGSSGKPWANVVFIKTGELRNAVLLPFPGDPDAFATFYEFLNNENTKIQIANGRFDREVGCWRVEPHFRPATWPKSDETYPLNLPRFY